MHNFFLLLRSRLTGSQLRRNMVSGVGLSLMAAATMALSYRAYLYTLGYERYGVWLILSTVLTFSQVGNLGISQAIAKRIAENAALGDMDNICSLYSSAIAIVAGSGIVISLAIILGRNTFISLLHLSGSDAQTARDLLPWISLFSIYIFFADISNNVLNGLGRMDLCATCQVLAQISSLLISLVVLHFNRSVASLLIGNVIGYFLAHMVSLFLGYRLTGRWLLHPSRASWRHARTLWSFGGWMFGSAILGLCYAPVNRLALTRFGSVATVPLFDLSYSASYRLRSLIEPALRSLMAETSMLISLGGREQLLRVKKLHRRSLWILALFSSAFLAVLLIGPLLMRLWLGAQYRSEIDLPFRVMLVAVYGGLLAAPAYYLLIGRGKTFLIFSAFGIQALINIAGLVFFVQTAHRLSVLSTVIAGSAAMVLSGAFLIVCELRAEFVDLHESVPLESLSPVTR